MGEVIPFPVKAKPSTERHVLIWQEPGWFNVTVFENGHERETEGYATYEDANARAASWLFLGATIEDRVGGDGAA